MKLTTPPKPPVSSSAVAEISMAPEKPGFRAAKTSAATNSCRISVVALGGQKGKRAE